MQQIADVAGVSRMAVSLALRNSPKISTQTSRRIRAIADELGYRPNPLVSALMTQLRHARETKRTSTIAYVTTDETEDGWQRPGPFVAFFEGARRRAEQLGYTLERWWLQRPGVTPERFCEILAHRDIHGMIVAPLPPGGGCPEVGWCDFAAATIGFSLTHPNLHRASNAQYTTILTALNELEKLGYRRIGLAMKAETDARVEHRWSAGMLVYQQKLAAADRVPLLLTDENFERGFATWLSDHQPDVVLTHEAQVLELLQGRGLRVPEDIGFAFLALTAERHLEWAGMDQNAELVGAAALDLVDAQLRRNERGVPKVPKTLLIPGFWLPGPTVHDVRRAPAIPLITRSDPSRPAAARVRA